MSINFAEVKYVSPKKDRGLVSKDFIKKGTILENAPVILLSNKDHNLIKDTILNNYIFEWDKPDDESEYKNAIVMSPCEFLNHSYDPNISYEKNFKERTIKFIAIKDIQPGEELTINYNGKLNDLNPVWFDLE
ncbi:MAG: SET domain-containing protein-lysine N-methyltransferase [Promethearchaeota archaeon]